MDTAAFDARYKKLNAAQREAVDAIEGPVMVVAGPGTGKTQVLALRVVNILRKTDAAPGNILCLTFTEAGAFAMRERLRAFIGQDAYRVGIYTFHAFCNSIISRYPESFYSAASYSLAGDLERAEIIDELFAKLPHGHPLASRHSELGYAYRRDIVERIKHIKGGGYTPEEYADLVERLISEHAAVNKAMSDWPARLSIKKLDVVHTVHDALMGLRSTYGAYLARTLNDAVKFAESDGKTEAIGEWKKKFFEKEGDAFILKDTARVAMVRAVAEFYREYEDALHARGLYDYDDMIIEVVHALKRAHAIRNELEEKYQHVLIDEFQDTNEAQMNLVRAITSNPVHEGRPNVMVVGDDDQAIYKFQGAELSNIIDFHERTYRGVRTIVLDVNYRSHQTILDYARSIVLQGKNRLESSASPALPKVLSQGNTSLSAGNVEVTRFASDSEEYSNIARKIHQLIDAGGDPREIAIIAREHKILQQILPYLDHEGVRYEYMRRANVFDEPHISELVTMCEFVASVNAKGGRRDDLLPTLLSFPYFNISRAVLFDIAIKAKDTHRSWPSVARDCGDPNVAKAMDLLGDLGVRADSVPLEHLLDEYMQRSGFRDHYFSRASIHERPVSYVSFLASLRTFIGALREWHEGKPLFVRDVGVFVELHRAAQVSLVCESPVIRSERSVLLMTAHGAKGLEFGSVFIIGAHDDVWTSSRKKNKVTLPAPIAPVISPAGDEEDDFIRLLYVAVTRAKHTLHISGHDTLLRYLPGANEERESSESAEVDEGVVRAHENALALVTPPYREDERAVLARVTEGYKLSVTHLNNFVNVAKGGPLYFVEQDLLRFPQPMSAPGVFGSAIDAALTELINYPKYHGVACELSHMLGVFERKLARGRLPDVEARRQRERGEKVLTRYYALRDEFRSDDEAQVDLGNDGVVIGDAPVGGRLDLLRVDDGAFRVIDFKTGKVCRSWNATSDTDKIKLHNYKQQLVFYKLLLDRSSRKRMPVAALALEFVEGVADEGERVLLEYVPTAEDEARLVKLVNAVYHRIISLDFPDITNYERTYKGVLTFEDDLIQGKV